MTSRSIHRLFLFTLLMLAVPTLFAGPVGAPPPGVERWITYWSCATGTPQYTGFEQWDCEGEYYHGGTISSNRAVVSDEGCEVYENEQTRYCKRYDGTWAQVSQTFFESCHVCTTIGN